MTPDDSGSERPKVFLSYAHDDADHVAAVLELANLLMDCGISVVLDKWDEYARQDWSAWMLRSIRSADFVIVVASPMYAAVGDGTPPENIHLGVQAEAAVLRDLLHRDRHTWLAKMLPVILPGRSLGELPDFVQPYSASHFVVEAVSQNGVEGLLRVITGQPRHVRPRYGRIPVLQSAPVSWSSSDWMRKKRRVAALAVTLLLVVLVLGKPGGGTDPPNADGYGTPEADSHVIDDTAAAGPPQSRPSATTAVTERSSSPGAGDQSRRAPAPDEDVRDAPAMPEGVPVTGMPSRQGVLDVLAVGHSFAGDVDRITVTVRNPHSNDVLVRQVDVLMDNKLRNYWSHDGLWRFVVSGDLVAGSPAYDGSRRVHGTVRMSGTEFSQPLVGRGYIDEQGNWRRLLTFTPQRFLAGSESMTIVIDVPITHLLQHTTANQPAGPVTEATLDPQQGAVFTRVDIWTPDDHSFGCDYLRRTEDNPVCDQVDPAAAVELPG